MGGKRGPRVLTRKLEPEEEQCVLTDNGVPCAKPRKTRGVCSGHMSYLRAHGLLELYALPATTPEERRHRYAVNPSPEPGACRVVEDGVPCTSTNDRRGLCRRHYQVIWYRSKQDLSLDDFCLPVSPRDVRLRKHEVEGECRAHEGGQDCHEPPHARGLCPRHYRLHESHPALFLKVALPDPKLRRFELRKRLVDGRCRVLEEGKGCALAVATRGLCQHHYSVLRSRPELLESLALPPVERAKRTFARAEDPSPAPLTCLVLENGTRCTRPPTYRGLCQPHHKRLGNHPDYSLHDFLLPVRDPVLVKKPLEEQEDGRCVLREDGASCLRPRLARGLCKRHYARVAEQKRLEELGLPARDRHETVSYGRGNDRPHVYLDKNVLFDHADALVFQASGQWSSLTVVEQVLAGAARASISADAIKATYNHVRHRLQRASQEGGRAAEEETAEARARQYVEDTFLRGAWRVIALGPSQFLEVVKNRDPRLSFEDALEFRAYQSARAEPGGPTMFVTRDTDFPEGVHPSAVVRSYGWTC